MSPNGMESGGMESGGMLNSCQAVEVVGDGLRQRTKSVFRQQQHRSGRSRSKPWLVGVNAVVCCKE